MKYFWFNEKVTADEIPASYEDILEMGTEAASVSGTETYADNTQYYGIPDDEIESRDMGEAIRNKEEEYEDEESIVYDGTDCSRPICIST